MTTPNPKAVSLCSLRGDELAAEIKKEEEQRRDQKVCAFDALFGDYLIARGKLAHG
jgi:hypothetical protein